MIELIISALAGAAWQCRNPVEIACADGACIAAPADAFTPMDISAEADGRLSVCAYSGCWEARARPVRKRGRLLYVADAARFSTSQDPAMRTDITLAIDTRTGEGFVMASGFANPLQCAQDATGR